MIKMFLLVYTMIVHGFAMEDSEQVIATATLLLNSENMPDVVVDAVPFDINSQIFNSIEELDERDQNFKKLLEIAAGINENYVKAFDHASSFEFIHLLLERTNSEAKIWNMFGTEWQNLLKEQETYLNEALERLGGTPCSESIESFDYTDKIKFFFANYNAMNERKFDVNDYRLNAASDLIKNLGIELYHCNRIINQMGINEVDGVTSDRATQLAYNKRGKENKSKVLLKLAELNLECAYLEECMFFLRANLDQQEGIDLLNNSEFIEKFTAHRGAIEQSRKNLECARKNRRDHSKRLN